MLDEMTLRRVEEFHGHMCPGLAMGIQIGEIAVKEMGRNTKENPVRAVVECNLCPVNAIQFLTGCTFGMGAIVYREWGKMGFSFFSLKDHRGIRIAPRQEAFEADPEYVEHNVLMTRVRAGEAGDADKARFHHLHHAQAERILHADPYDLYAVAELAGPAPALIHGHADAVCATCGEGVAEECTRRHAGTTLCIPCFEAALVPA